ncbi:hypothetical protein [Puia dinghuensis]|uniref:Uncharacterized protein n=1 Tax=Puia dinghuensis TaxID=1792502 RepID=A0A8J2UHY4_9BACT|nr:hypothetical protein [Puia dinghuensis]GGB19520.1 hypothetical protein GCM10011511_49050 [Puia dinghuensis]
MCAAKVLLSAEEMRLVTDAGVILTKNSVMAKVVELLAGLSEDYRPVWDAATAAGEEWGATSPKISRGENYLGLPWAILDYPRFFGREDTFAIRTMFWWGHAFSVTLHLKGRYKELYLPVIEKNWLLLADEGFHVGVSEDEWRHEHVPDNYGVVSNADSLRRDGDFLKLSAAVELHRWEDVPELLLGMFKTLITVLF